MFSQVLVVCVGNICRSPMAEWMLADVLRKMDGNSITVSSAGLGALVDQPADRTAWRLLCERGIDMSAHRARQLSPEMVHDADLVLVMEREHKRVLESAYPIARGKVFRLGEWGDFEVPDPYRQSDAVFEQVLDLIGRGVSEWIPRLKGSL